jgi:hypothetical protein
MYSISLRIADVIIKMQSKYFLQLFDFKDKMDFRFRNFVYKGKKGPEIIIDVDIVREFPKFPDAKNVFITYHFQDGSENWRLLRRGNSYIYKCPLEDKKQVMVVNRYFNRVKAYLLPKNENKVSDEKERKLAKEYKGSFWNVSDIIYDFLQVLLINYLAIIKKDGIFVHGMGVKDMDKDGLLFAGKSQSGKTTLAKIYHKDSDALVLNDDRIIARKKNNDFYIYGSPWHGEFSDYLESRIESAKLKGIFFLQKAKKNSIKSISVSKAFKYLYPAMFPTFWDKRGTEMITMFLTDLLSKTTCFRLKFRKDKSVIKFIKEVEYVQKTKIQT